jgi:septal ring factor EnvC (AmiA/AmiB activator)
MLRLTDAAGERLYESLIGNFRGYQADLNALIDTIGSQRSDKKQLDDALGAVGDTIDALRTKIGGLRGSIAQLHSSESTNREPVQPA